MAKDKKSFIFYCDWKDTFDQLPDEKAGQLIKHMLAYVNDEDPQTDDLLISAVFANMKNTLKRDLKKFEEIKKKRSDAGKKSAEKRAQQKSSKSTSVESVQQNSANSTVSDNDSVSDNVTDTENDNSNSANKSAGAGKKDFIKRIIDLWCDRYLQNRGEEYLITTPGKEKLAAGKIANINKKRFPDANSEEALEQIGAMFDLCLTIQDSWLYNNMSMTTIYTKLNEIKTTLSNENRNGNNQGANGHELREVFENHFGQE